MKKNNNKKSNNFKLPLLIVIVTIVVGIVLGMGIMYFSTSTNKELSNTTYAAAAKKTSKKKTSSKKSSKKSSSKKSSSKKSSSKKSSSKKSSSKKSSSQKSSSKKSSSKKSSSKKSSSQKSSSKKSSSKKSSSKKSSSKKASSKKSSSKNSSSKQATSSVGKGNTTISALTVKDANTGASANVKFNSTNDTYTVTVANSISKVRVNVETKNPKATITEPAGLKGDKVVTWEVEAGKTKTVKINVKSENGNKNNSYTLKITREAKPKTKSSDATLKSFKIYKTEGYNAITKTGTEINASWDKNFNKNTTAYNIKLPSGVNSIKIVAYPSDNGAVISSPYAMRNNQAEYGFKAGETRNPTITVTAENGTTKTYNFKITSTSSTSATRYTSDTVRVKSSDATIKSLKVGNKNVTLVKDKYVYDVNVEEGKKALEVKLNNQYAMVLTPSGLRDLNETYTIEANKTKTISLKIQAENGITKIYSINIKGIKSTSSSTTSKKTSSKKNSSKKNSSKKSSSKKATSSVGKGNTTISALTVKDANTGASANVKFNSTNDTYTVTVANSISKVRVNVETKNPKATITEPAGLKGDKVVTWEVEAGKTKTVKINVKSENGNKNNSYTLKITREAKPKTKSSDATLKSFKIYKTEGYNKTTKTGKEIKGSWDNNFNKNTTSYNIILPSGTKDFEIVAYPNDNGAVISSPVGMINNQAKHIITNKKTIQIVVKAENGTTKTYTFNMTVKGSLSSTANDGAEPEVDPDEDGNDGDGEYIEPEEENDGNGDYIEQEENDLEEEKNTVKKIVVNNEEIKLNKGRSAEMVAIVLPGTVTNREVTWETADESIATIDENGMIYGVNAGTTTIIATSVSDPEIQKTINVTISESTVNTVNNTINTINNNKEKLYDINKDNIVNLVDYSILCGIYLNNPQYLNNEKYSEWKEQLDLINPAGIDLNDTSSMMHYILYKE